MKIKAILTMLIMLGGACMYALPDTADAARLGGGRSFGSRPSMSQPAQAPSAMQRQSTQQRQQAAQKQSLKEKRKAAQEAKAAKAKKAATSTTEAGRVGDRPYARGRSYKADRYDSEQE